MAPLSREAILDQIRRTAEPNGGKPLGRERFVRITGITEYEIGAYWARWSDAQREAGFEPNALNAAHGGDFLLDKYIGLVRKLGHVPTSPEMRLERASDPAFPNPKTYMRFGSKNDLIGAALSACRERPEAADVVPILESACKPTATEREQPSVLADTAGYGFVYLVQGHRGEYKIGRSNIVGRRVAELGTTSAVALDVVHEIRTDDTAGVEAYWHRRFEAKRMKGEWFKLTTADVAAFKRWKRIA